MPLLVWGVIGVAGLFGVGYVADKTGEAAEGSAQLLKWATAAGIVYVGYRVARSSGALK